MTGSALFTPSQDRSVFHVGYSGEAWFSPKTASEYHSLSDESIVFKSIGVGKGQSGGPLVNQAWQVIGLIIQVNGESSSSARPIDIAEKAVRRAGHAFELTPGLSLDLVQSESERAEVRARISTDLNEYRYRLRDLVAFMDAEMISHREDYYDRVKWYNAAFQSLSNNREVLLTRTHSLWGRVQADTLQDIYDTVSGLANDPYVWKLGEIGLHPAVYQGMLHATQRYNENPVSASIPKPYYQEYLNEIQAQQQVFERKLERFLVGLSSK